MYKTLPQLNNCQEKVIDKVIDGFNVICDSTAGSGKSTVGYHVAAEMQKRSKSCFLMVYNANMKDETRAAAKLCELSNMTAHTYHSAAKSLYGMEGYDDSALRKCIANGMTPVKPFEYEVIVLDELQDMTPEYYKLVTKMLQDNQIRNPQIVCLGDKFQNVNSFKGSDSRFLTMADALFSMHSCREWHRVVLDVSERVPSRVADIINTDFLGYPRMKSSRTGGKVHYLVLNVFKDLEIYARYVLEAIAKYTADDILVLQPSYKSNKSPAKLLENYLVSRGIACDIPSHDDEEKPAAVLEGKVAFQTFHACKGTTRKIVFVFGVDGDYHKYYAREISTNICPNPVYVALSRTCQRLVLITDSSKEAFPTIRIDTLHERATILDLGQSSGVDRPEQPIKHRTDVAGLVRYLSNETMTAALKLLNVVELVEPAKAIDMPSTVESGDYTEAVSDINGITIPALFELRSNNRCSMVTILDKIQLDRSSRTFLNKCKKQISGGGGLDVPTVSQLGVLFMSKRNGVNSRKSFLKKYDWLDPEKADQCVARLSEVVSEQCRCEVEMKSIVGDTEIYGQADVIDDANRKIFEIKCKAALSDDDLLQLALYAFLHNTQGFEYILFNLRTGQQRQISASYENLLSMAKILIEAKTTKSLISDAMFLKALDL